MTWQPFKWVLTNQFQHARSFLGPSMRHRSVPLELRERIEMRIRAGKRLILVRLILVVMLFVGVGFITTFLAGWTTGPARTFIQVLSIVLPIIAAPAVLLVSRSIRLLETDIQILAAEVIARCQQAGGPLPSQYRVRLGKHK